jgi:hypothetical protein
MGTETATVTAPASDRAVEEKIHQLRELFADAPEVGKAALENALHELTSQAATTPPPPIESAGRVGSRLGNVSELTIIVPLAPGGAKRLRAFLQLLGGNLAGADKVGSVHDMRFVFLDNDTRMLFATTFDGDWDAYIDDFIAKIPDYLDIIDSAWEGWPGIRHPGAKDYLVKHQITAEGWYVGNPNLTVADTKRLERVGQAVDEFLDKVGDE